MKLTIHEDGVTEVILSKKNLLAGLHKLEMEGSLRTIVSGDSRLVLRFESDEEHYRDRLPAGTMHPETERFIAEVVAGPCDSCDELPPEFPFPDCKCFS